MKETQLSGQPPRLAFLYQGVQFCELKSAAALKNLTFAK